jgi:protein-S-isoprenylcysteine O-methyltransferase Ste14
MQHEIMNRSKSGEGVFSSVSNEHENTREHPGIYIPPPLIYAAFFIVSFLLQKRWPLNRGWLDTSLAQAAGWLLVALYLILAFISIRQFVVSKNTIVTIKPATSLQTNGIYAFTRNPMYLSLLFLYSGLAVFFGNWWTFMMLPFLVISIQWYVIRKEEEYLHHAFGTQFEAYKRKVRRWI